MKIVRNTVLAIVGFVLGLALMPFVPFYVAACGWTYRDEEEEDSKE